MTGATLLHSGDGSPERVTLAEHGAHSNPMLTVLDSAKVINRYCAHLTARKCAPTTLRTARWVLNHFAHTYGQPILDATPDDIDDWMAERATEVAGPTLRNQASYLRCFFRWAAAHDYITTDPSRRMAMPRATRRRPRPIPEHQLRLALDAADGYTLAILCLAAMAGLRACEVARLDWTEVTLAGDAPELRIVGKGNTEDIVELSAELAAVLTALPQRRGPVIRRLDGMPGCNHPTRISQIGNRHLHGLGIPDNFHSLRHRFVTRVYGASKDLRATQEAARHASPTTTAGYAAVARRGVREAIAAAGSVGGGAA